VLTGNACQRSCTIANTTACSGASSDQCCPETCNNSSDADCNGSWTTQTLTTGLAFESSACSDVTATLTAGHDYAVTTCQPTAPALAGAGDTIIEVYDPLGTQVTINDDCDGGAGVPVLAGWSCVNGNGAPWASCPADAAGGFRATMTGIYRFCVRAYSNTSGTSSTGATATVTLFSN
jgi:hypothetical protein